jgi:hypothetical protein
MLPVGFADMLRRIRLEQEIFEFTLDKIAGAGMESTKIDPQPDLHPAHIGEVPGQDHLQDVLLIDDFLKHRVEPDLIPAHGRGTDAQGQRAVRLEASHRRQDTTIGLRDPMMPFIDNDRLEHSG